MRNTVADNQTYKNQYHFTDDFRDTARENPSIEGPSKINTTIKENPYRSNVEIEGGEIVLQPDLSALFKAQGKKHSRGGMDVLLRPDSFVFSDFKDLAITEDEKETFELKKGGSTDPQKNTPAEVLKKNVNVKHYNTLIDNIVNPFKDDLARKSSAMMLDKYIATLGNIAFLQEKKKEFPDGLPPFSMGTAPIFEAETKQKMDETKQFAKYGGTVYSTGGLTPEVCPCGKDSKGNCLPCSQAQLKELANKATRGKKGDEKGMNFIGKDDNLSIYHVGTDPSIKNINVPRGIPGGQANNSWKKKMQSLIDQGATLDQLVQQKHGTREGLSKMFKFPLPVPGTDKLLAIPEEISTVAPPVAKTPPDVPTPGEVTGDPQYGKTVDWRFTPWQKVSQLYNWGQYANVKRYMPYRSRYDATYADPMLLNPEQAVGDVKGQVTQQLNALGTLNPIMRNAQAAASYGAALNQIPAIRSQYDNQNAQIANQFRQYNNQVRNNESLVNMQNDQTYYQQAIEGRKNFDNLRTFTANNAMNNVLRDVETNQKLAYNLLTQNNPAYSFDWKTGDFVRNPKDIRDSASTNSSDFYTDFLKELDEARTTEDLEKLKIKERLMRQKNILPFLQQQSMGLKKGGKMKNPYK